MSVVAAGGFASPSQAVAFDGKVLLAWDGRLDNRSAIAEQCKLEPTEDLDDALVVAAAYSSLGPAIWPLLIGDYSVACWDSTTKELYLARDPFGTRPLYYYVDDSTAIWCSELTYFVDSLNDTLELDDEFIVSFLLAVEAQPKTPYRSISSVRPGYVTIISQEHVSQSLLWNAAACGDVKLGSDSEYESRFRELFAQSVGRRLRTPGVAIAELSGGLDSSSIVCMADQLLRAQKESAKLATISYLYDESHTADERPFIAEVEKLRGRETHFIRDRNMLPLAGVPRAPRPSGLYLFDETYKVFSGVVRSLDASILLSGFGGDEVTLNGEPVCPGSVSLLKRGQPFAAFRVARTWAQVHKTTTIELFWTNAILPLLPLRLQSALAPDTFFPKAWMGPAFIRRLGLWKHHMNQGIHSSSDPVRRRQYNALNRALAFTSQCYYREQGCCDVTYPFLDRCLIEFLIGIPADQNLRPAESRSLHRRALKGVLPDRIRQRKTKQGPEEPLLRALSRTGQELTEMFRTAEVCRRGYVADAFLGDLQRARHGICRFTAPLARVLSLELWLRGHARRLARSAISESSPMRESPVVQSPSHNARGIPHIAGSDFVEATTERR